MTIENGIIKKECRTQKEFYRELFVYRHTLPFLPRFIGFEEPHTIIIEKIEGVHLDEKMALDFSLFSKMFSILHFATFDSRMVICHSDTNPRNYLIRNSDKKYFMIDFSESCYNYPEVDLTNFLLFWASCYEPARFRNSMTLFLRAYNAKILLTKQNRVNLYRLIHFFDMRRAKYGKSPCANSSWQTSNRHILVNDFYNLLLPKQN